ncbi:MAG: hypothetical protein O7A06_06170 [Acidobacteria bacterium]|nr:hypothetical protein [Acidobacteriota bacterium]MCZ6490099.1 hypothetical protein [Acidobacteriota bacterium]MCZ6753350.1 hypothetical protein [Acidobacteriota bacterium]
MKDRWISFVALGGIALAFSPLLLAQTAQQPGAAKAQSATPTPDLSGVWVVRELSDTFDMKVEPPMQPWAEEKFKALSGRELDPIESCFPYGVPRIFLSRRPFEIVQNPGRVLILFEQDHWVRQIHMDGRKHPGPEDLFPTWMGHSIGHYDGDTLVVDTIGRNDKTWLDNVGHPNTDALHVVEHFRRVDQNTLVIDVTIDDPKAYTKPWSGQKVFQLRSDWEVWEHVECEERLELTPWTEQ